MDEQLYDEITGPGLPGRDLISAGWKRRYMTVFSLKHGAWSMEHGHSIMFQQFFDLQTDMHDWNSGIVE